MAGGVTLQVRQIASYPLVAAVPPESLVLVQPGGLGNPYASVSAQALVASALNDSGSLGVGPYVVPSDAAPGQVFLGTLVSPQPAGGPLYNLYFDTTNALRYSQSGIGGAEAFENGDFAWQVAPPGAAGASVPQGTLSDLMILTAAGALSLQQGTLTVARDPGAAMEVATMGWVGRSTVTSFNGRQGAITLNGCDIYGALCLDSTIATENWVNANIQASIQMLLANHPFVFGWNGRTGAVYLTLADISCVFFQPGQQPITQTPPLTSNDYSIPNTAWVVEYIANEFAGGGSTLATQSWVLANTVNSFNGRTGVVTLTSSDVFDVGAAPLNSPAFSGIPTAPTAAIGQATGQIATTAFVQMAISHNTAGVSTFNTRAGDVVLEAADVIGVGGLVNPSPNLTGNPTAPTQPPGTNLPVIATCEFVQAALSSGAVSSFNTRTGAVTLTLADVTGVGGAPLVSPAFSSVPTAPTAAPGTNTVQLATTAFVTAAVTAAGGVSSFNGRTGVVDLIPNDISAAGGLVNPSVGLTGSPTATTATAGDNSTRIATTAFVTTALSSGAVSSFNTRTGAVTLQGADITAAGGALLASPAFTGAPTAPTATAGTNNSQIATTAYVTAAILADTTGVTSFNTRTGAISLLLADITGAGGAPLASPSFTGVPLGPTATAGTSTTQLATTAFVQAAIASSGVSSFNARTGAVTLIANDISAAGGALLASPTFTGVPAAPTAAPGTNTTQLATTAFVAAALGSYLPLSGGTLTGPLSLSNGTSTTPALTIGSGGGFWSPSSGNIATGATLNAPTLYASGSLGSGGSLTAVGAALLQGGLNVTGAIAATTTITAGGTITSNAGRILSIGNANNPSVAAWNSQSGGGVYGLWSGSPPNAWLFFGQMDTTGTPITNFGHFDGGGNLTISGTLTQGSDAASKTAMAPIAQGVSLIKQLIPKSFAWATSPQKTQWGFIAQDVESVIPPAVSLSMGLDNSASLSLDTTAILAAAVYAIQQLLSRVASLEANANITPPEADVA